jgi:hypothetical protein
MPFSPAENRRMLPTGAIAIAFKGSMQKMARSPVQLKP